MRGHWPSSAPGRAALRLVLLVRIAAGACSRPPEPAVVEALTGGVWHATIGADDYLYQLTFRDGAFGGRIHRVHDGRQISEIPVTGLAFGAGALRIEHGRLPPDEGRADLAAGRIERGAPAAPAFRDMNLTRVEPAAWPMLQLRPGAPTEGPAGLWTRPRARDDGWPTAAPSEVGIDPIAVDKSLRAIVAGEAAALHSLLVVRDGRLVVEEYFHRSKADDLHPLLSCTKSVASLLVGLAIDRGHLGVVDPLLLDFFPDHADRTDPGWETMRLEHLLTMTMGLDWARQEIGTPTPPGVSWFADVLGRRVSSLPGTRFRYVGRNVNLLARVLLQTTGVEPDALAREHLFAPLGITAWDWEDRRWQGHPPLSAGLELRPRDMAKLGQLVLDGGTWQGRQAISAEWVSESTRTHIAQTPHEVQYGYLWWRIDPPPPGSVLGALTFANGIGSQFLAIVPDARLVLVTTGGNFFNGRQFDIARVVQRYLAPGLGEALR